MVASTISTERETTQVRRRKRASQCRWRAELEAGRAPREGQLAYQYPQRSVTGVPASLAPAEARRLLLETLEQQLRKDRRIEEGRDDTDFK